MTAPAVSPFIIVAIDGGAGTGKSSSATLLSERFNLLHVDTGSFYRAATAEFLRLGVTAADPAAVRGAISGLQLRTRLNGRDAQMEIGGRVVPDAEIRSPAVNAGVSLFAALPEVRAALLDYQRQLADFARAHSFRGIVLGGRDIGSVIFPDADFRFFLHVDEAVAEQRRARQGQSDSIKERNRLDSSRKTAPLLCPAGASYIDTTQLTLAEVVEKMAAPIAAKLGVP
ncbi:MAG: (d)CMP kinase [Opitutaceae bacterium]|nr:(d)CMP kinase [Opitutaceae bacterium]